MLNTLTLFAEFPARSSGDGKSLGSEVWLTLIAVAVVLTLFGLVMLLARRYKRCPSNRVLVIYGKTGGGNAAQLHPRRRRLRPAAHPGLRLSQPGADADRDPAQGRLSIENIRVNVPSVFTVAIGTDPEVMQNAAIRLLGLSTEEVKQQAGDIIFGQLRQVIASMRIEDINRDRDKFLESIQTSLEPELQKIGLVLINVNITDITDESGYIEAIGQKAASQAVQQARVDVAEQEKLGEIGVAEAEREKAIQVANATKLREIGTARARMREQAGRAWPSCDKEQQGRRADRRPSSATTSGEGRRAADAHSRWPTPTPRPSPARPRPRPRSPHSQATLQVKQAEAYQLGETRKREAEAAVQEAQNRAMAKAALAEAERVEAENGARPWRPRPRPRRPRSSSRPRPRPRSAASRPKARPPPSSPSSKPRPAASTKSWPRRAKACEQIIEACGGAQQAFQMLMLEHLDTLAEASAKAISNIKFDKVVVWENGQRQRPRQQHGQLPAKHGPHAAADDAGDEGHRRRRDAGIPGPIDAGTGDAQRRRDTGGEGRDGTVRQQCRAASQGIRVRRLWKKWAAGRDRNVSSGGPFARGSGGRGQV